MYVKGRNFWYLCVVCSVNYAVSCFLISVLVSCQAMSFRCIFCAYIVLLDMSLNLVLTEWIFATKDIMALFNSVLTCEYNSCSPLILTDHLPLPKILTKRVRNMLHFGENYGWQYTKPNFYYIRIFNFKLFNVKKGNFLPYFSKTLLLFFYFNMETLIEQHLLLC